MENLIIDLKEKLLRRRELEMNRIQNSDKEKDSKIILISSGRIFELDHIIESLENMLTYHNQTKKNVQ
jgi:hypothetical protein